LQAFGLGSRYLIQPTQLNKLMQRKMLSCHAASVLSFLDQNGVCWNIPGLREEHVYVLVAGI
jgi:hypothetical protein